MDIDAKISNKILADSSQHIVLKRERERGGGKEGKKSCTGAREMASN